MTERPPTTTTTNNSNTAAATTTIINNNNATTTTTTITTTNAPPNPNHQQQQVTTAATVRGLPRFSRTAFRPLGLCSGSVPHSIMDLNTHYTYVGRSVAKAIPMVHGAYRLKSLLRPQINKART